MSAIKTVELVLVLTVICLLLSLFIFLYLLETALTTQEQNTIYDFFESLGEYLCYYCKNNRAVIIPVDRQEPPRTIIEDHVIIENPMGLISLGTPSYEKT